MRCRIAVLACLVAALVALAASVAEAKPQTLNEKDWTVIVQRPQPPRRGKERPPVDAGLWLPEGVERVRGLFFPGMVMIEKKLAMNPKVRAALAELGMGVLWYPLGSNLIHGQGAYLEETLAALAAASGHPEVEFAPLLTAGHSAAGLFCRNVAYWKPHRVIGVVMIKSGNFHHAIEDTSRSLAGVPLVHFSGEFEEYGPEARDLHRGLRPQYVTTGPDGKSRNQTQWVMTRMQMLRRRRRNEDNVWTLVVHRGGGHTAWNADMTDLFIRYVRSVAALRIPKGPPDGKTEVRCVPVTAEDGWLYDADIKNPTHKPAPYAAYTGDKALAFWAPDEATAVAVWTYHQREAWSHPDPTAGQPPEARFEPPPILRDYLDGPPPPALTWSDGDGTWDGEAKVWRPERGSGVAWDEWHRAIIPEGRVRLEASRRCLGLVLGKGATLAVGTHRLGVTWDARVADGATVRVRLDETSPRDAGWRGACVSIGGNAEVGGTLVVEAEGDLKEGAYGVFQVKGLRAGDFAKVVVPEPYTGGWIGGTYCVTVPHVLTEAELKKQAAEAARKATAKKEAAIREMFDLPGAPAGEAPASPALGL